MAARKGIFMTQDSKNDIKRYYIAYVDLLGYKDFFEKHPDLLGRKSGLYGAMCTSNPAVMEYLRYAVRCWFEEDHQIADPLSKEGRIELSEKLLSIQFAMRLL